MKIRLTRPFFATKLYKLWSDRGMPSYVSFLQEILDRFFGGIWEVIKNFFTGNFEIYNIPEYFKSLNEYKDGFDGGAWALAIVTIIVLFALMIGIIFLVYLAIRKFVRIMRNQKSNEVLVNEIGKLNQQVIRLNKEKDRLLELRVAQYGGNGLIPWDDEENGEGQSQTVATQTGDSRFTKLVQVDNRYKDYDPESYVFAESISLEELCNKFRDFACSRMGLYYDIRIVRLFMAGLASTRLIILQGISGTGKTSFPYAWGKFVENDSLIASVQPSWRDRTELFGYFNEFTKKFNETEVLKQMYEARYTDKMFLTILDEMNIARVEYYFAEMLSILEMPSRDEWVVDLAPSGWANDPKLLENGRFRLPENMWYIGTANNDDSTFAISDKVYDRAIPININSKGIKFDAPMTDPVHVNYRDLERQFDEAKLNNKVSAESLEKIDHLDNYVIEHFRIAFGNRIVKQLREFVPVYIACGGTEVDGLDYVLCNKIFRKFEQLNLSFIRDEIDGLIDYLSELFGEANMSESKEYLRRLSKLV